MKPQNVRDQKGVIITMRPPIIKPLFKSTLNPKHSNYPMCLACKLATAKARSTDVVTTKPIASKEGALSCNQYEPGNSITTDQFIVMTPGRLQTGYGREGAQNCFHGGPYFKIPPSIKFAFNLKFI